MRICDTNREVMTILDETAMMIALLEIKIHINQG